jgi:uncharacterized protein YggE
MKSHLAGWLTVLVLGVCSVRWVGAAEDSGITVSGTGEVKARPSQVEIELQTGGSAELTGDAIVKYRDAKRRTLEAFTKLKIKDLEIQEQGIGLANANNMAQQMVFNPGGQAPAVKPQVEISRSIRVVLRNIEKIPEEELMETIGKLLDTAKDAGATVGMSQAGAIMARMFGQQMSSSMATFVLEDVAPLREQAYQKAMEDARSRAVRLAALADVKLGHVLSVQEVATVATDDSTTPQRIMMAMYGLRDTAAKEDTRVTADKFSEIPVRVSLQVRFAIEKRE